MGNKDVSDDQLAARSPTEFRAIVRRVEWTKPSITACRSYAQANLAVVPKDMAFDFLLFCYRNPRPCPIIDVTEVGGYHPKVVAPQADLRTDLPRYRVYKDGELIDEPTDVTAYWRDDLVAFLIGCSASFEWSLKAANVQYRFPGAYTSNIACIPAGCFHGHVVVSCRLMKGGFDAVRAIQISSRHIAVHGPPIHIGDPALIGIEDLYHPDVGGVGLTFSVEPSEIPLFWGCGITPQVVALESEVPFMITHYPFHMFVTDRFAEELAAL